MPNNKQARAQDKVRRILLTIDRMASFRFPKTIDQIAELMEVSRKTAERDLELLDSMGLLERIDVTSTTPQRYGRATIAYRLRRDRSDNLQTGAILLDE